MLHVAPTSLQMKLFTCMWQTRAHRHTHSCWNAFKDPHCPHSPLPPQIKLAEKEWGTEAWCWMGSRYLYHLNPDTPPLPALPPEVRSKTPMPLQLPSGFAPCSPLHCRQIWLNPASSYQGLRKSRLKKKKKKSTGDWKMKISHKNPRIKMATSLLSMPTFFWHAHPLLSPLPLQGMQFFFFMCWWWRAKHVVFSESN